MDSSATTKDKSVVVKKIMNRNLRICIVFIELVGVMRGQAQDLRKHPSKNPLQRFFADRIIEIFIYTS